FLALSSVHDIYTLSLHDALPISSKLGRRIEFALALLTALATSGAIRAHARTVTVLPCSYPFKSTDPRTYVAFNESEVLRAFSPRSEEHTSELQSRVDLVCRLLLE